MAKMLFFTLTVLIISGIVWYAAKVLMPQSPPQLDLEEWWGPKEMKGKEDRSIRPFQVNFSAELITDLRQRLKSHRPAVLPLEDVGFQYGFNSKALAPWVKYWAEEYPFAERQKFLNKYPQFKTNVQGLDIHFIRVKPEVSDKVNVVPLLLLHGWPGSVREFYEAIPLLTKQQDGYDFAFEVIVPSLPGYGFSDPAVRPGLGPTQMGVIFRNLMKQLGLKQFYVQGGDWGAGVAGAMTVLFPKDPAVRPGLGPAQMGVIFRNLMKQLGLKQFYVQGGDWGAGVAGAMTVLFPRDVIGYHSNMLFISNGWSQLRTVLGAFIPSLVVEPHLTDRMYPLTKFFAYLMEEFGYFHLQATKPDTVGIALTDSPTGLLAYILEKFSSWTKFENRASQDGGLSKFTREQLIDNLMMYWASNSITTSMRLYSEAMTNKNRKLGLDKYTTPVPTWALQAKNELFYQPPSILRIKFTNLLGNTVLDEGGHFIAFELPDVFAKDVFKAVQKFRAFHGMKTEL